MAYIMWFGIGVLVGSIVGANPRRLAYRPFANGSLLAGGLGGIIGGFVAGGITAAGFGRFTIASILGAAIGAALISWFVRDRASDIDF